MKKNTLLIILSIVEILSIILFIATFSIAIEAAIDDMTRAWIGPVTTLTSWDKFWIKINGITPYILLCTFITRFILISKKCMIALVLSIFLAYISLILLFYGKWFITVFGIILLIITIIIYAYSHKLDFKDSSKVSDLFYKK